MPDHPTHDRRAAGLKVLSVTSELFPIVKTGGLADVAGALPGALKPHGIEMRSLLPGYPPVLAAVGEAAVVLAWPDLFGGPARLLSGTAAGLRLLVIDAPHLYDRAGGPYAAADGADHADNALRFAALSFVGATIGMGALPDFVPDIVHAHDWQAGLTPIYLDAMGGARPGTVMTVHNLAFHGRFDAAVFGGLGLPDDAFGIDGVEFYGGVGFLKAGLRRADRITTVSPSYAAEICTPEGGMGLDGLLRSRADVLSGILNGIDTAVWDPAHDPHVAPFGVHRLRRRARNKAALQSRLGLNADPAALLFGIVSRLTHQKGMDLVLAAVPALLEQGAQLAVLGTGEAGVQDGFVAVAAAAKGRVGLVAGFDEALAHLVQAGSDALLVPSRFEPCGLTQLCALRYGTVPVVARVGGLADTVIDANAAALAAGVATGVQFAPVSVPGLEAAISRTARLWQQPKTWARLQRNAMRADVGWDGP
ncbi:MAG: glycogen synthase GlgA, partial [Gemmatimonadaceae bacterium]|nr:glycogen synthase GlgA [Acetobacteraceae bacterium]